MTAMMGRAGRGVSGEVTSEVIEELADNHGNRRWQWAWARAARYDERRISTRMMIQKYSPQTHSPTAHTASSFTHVDAGRRDGASVCGVGGLGGACGMRTAGGSRPGRGLAIIPGLERLQRLHARRELRLFHQHHRQPVTNGIPQPADLRHEEIPL